MIGLPHRVTQVSTEVTKMDRAGSGVRQALGPHQLVCGNLSSKRFTRYWGQLGLSQVTHKWVLRTFPLAVPLFLTKGALVWAQADFLVISPASLAFQGPLWWVKEQPKAVFSSLGFYPYWPPLLCLCCCRPWRLASTKADSGIWGPVWSFCNCIWMSGVA